MNEIFNRQWLTLPIEKKHQILKQDLGDLKLYVVYVAEEEDLLKGVSHLIEEMGLTAYATTRANEAVKFINQHRSNVVLVLSEYKMPNLSGFDLRSKLCEGAKEVPFAILSGFVDREMALRGMELKIATFLDKPLNENTFLDLLRKEVLPRLQTIKDDRKLLSGFAEDAANLLELEENPSDLNAESTKAETESGITSLKNKGPDELKVAVSLLDEFMQSSGEMTVIRNMLNKTVRNIEKTYPGDKDISLLSELLGELHKINGTVQSKMTELRKVPFRNVVKPITRIVREVSSVLAKDVDFNVCGENIRIDNSLAKVLSNSLAHLVRNSLDHGIETPAERATLGKPRKGSIALRCEIRGENIAVELVDDGRGINLNAITDLAGHGVGMRMVKDSVESIGGKILVQSEDGKGSKFTLDLPIPRSVLITNCLFVTFDQVQVGIPQDQVSRIVKLTDDNRKELVERLEGTFVIRQQGKIIPLIHLRETLGGPPHDLVQGQVDVVILKTTKGLEYGLIVESVLDVEDTVVKTLSGQIKRLGIYMGGTFLGDGTVGLIMNVDGIATRAGLNNEFYIEPEVVNEKIVNQNAESILLFDLDWPGNFGFFQKDVFRIEEINRNQLQRSGELTVLPYREGVMTVLDVATVLENDGTSLSPISEKQWPEQLQLVVIQVEKNYLGLHVKRIKDMVEAEGKPQPALNKAFGLYGTLLVRDSLVSIVSPVELTEALYAQSGKVESSPNSTSSAESEAAA